MGRENLETRRQALERVRATVQRQLFESETASVQALSAYDNHPADLASDTVQRELQVGLARGLAQQLEQVRRAMFKQERGTYGLCDRCGNPIGAQRLAVMPEAILCLSCQQAQSADFNGPSWKGVVDPKSSCAVADTDEGAVEMTGEDFWQAVAQFGTSDTPQDMPLAAQYGELFPDFNEDGGSVEAIEEIVDSEGDVLFDRIRQNTRPGPGYSDDPAHL
jgi:DnaK suppressor protein